MKKKQKHCNKPRLTEKIILGISFHFFFFLFVWCDYQLEGFKKSDRHQQIFSIIDVSTKFSFYLQPSPGCIKKQKTAILNVCIWAQRCCRFTSSCCNRVLTCFIWMNCRLCKCLCTKHIFSFICTDCTWQNIELDKYWTWSVAIGKDNNRLKWL